MTTPTPGSPTLVLTADKQVYNPGDTITVTAVYDDGSAVQVPFTISGTATDANGNSVSATLGVAVNSTQPQPMQVAVSDSLGDGYTQVSNDNVSTAVFTATVGTPPASGAAETTEPAKS